MRAEAFSHNSDDTDASGAPFNPDVIYLSTSEWLIRFERDVQDVLGIDAAEFARRYRDGAYDGEDPEVTLLSTALPFYETVVAS